MQELLSYIDEKDVSEDAILWGIRRNEDSILVGTVKLEPINLSDGSAWLGIMIGDVNSRAKGYGTEATKLVLDFARDRLNLNKIYLGVHVENQLALKMYKKIGFEELKTELNQLKMLKRL
jgi:RimJ/RimL family protein N-acetyltransferase